MRFSGFVKSSQAIFIVLILLISLCVSVNSFNSWSILQISPEILCSMSYGFISIDIYEQSNNSVLPISQRMYYYTPTPLLDYQSAKVINGVNISIRVEMWNASVNNEVVEFLKLYEGQNLTSDQVKVFPLEKIFLSTTLPTTLQYSSFDSLLFQNNQSVQFTIPCNNEKDCAQLIKTMQTNPKEFTSFKLLGLSLNPPANKSITIPFENIASSRMVSKLLKRYDKEKEIFLTKSDMECLVNEVISNLMIHSSNVFEVYSLNSEPKISVELFNMLVSSTNLTKSRQSNKTWETVYWEIENDRPDKTSKTLNRIYGNQYPTHKQDKGQDMRKAYNLSAGGNLNTSFRFSSVDPYQAKDGPYKRLEPEELDYLYQVSIDHVEWYVDKFTPKPVILVRLDLDKLRYKETFENLSNSKLITVTYSNAFLTVPVNVITDNLPPLMPPLMGGNISVKHLKCYMARMSRIPVQQLKYYKKELEKQIQTRKNLEEKFRILKEKINAIQRLDGAEKTDNMKGVPFFAKRNNTFSKAGFIPFTMNQFNTSRGFSISSGIFTAPVPGPYHFYFSGLKQKRELSGTSRLTVQLIVTKKIDGKQTILTEGHLNSNDLYGWFPLHMQATVDLEVGDRVHVSLTEGAIHESFDREHFLTVFGGYCL